jgi:hypothetical protein
LSSRMETKGCCLLVSDVGDGVITEASNQSLASKTSGFLVSKIKSRDQFVQENAHWHQICVDASSLPFKAKQRFGEACARYSQLEWCKILLLVRLAPPHLIATRYWVREFNALIISNALIFLYK